LAIVGYRSDTHYIKKLFNQRVSTFLDKVNCCCQRYFIASPFLRNIESVGTHPTGVAQNFSSVLHCFTRESPISHQCALI
jgi:hypothetical protein